MILGGEKQLSSILSGAAVSSAELRKAVVWDNIPSWICLCRTQILEPEDSARSPGGSLFNQARVDNYSNGVSLVNMTCTASEWSNRGGSDRNGLNAFQWLLNRFGQRQKMQHLPDNLDENSGNSLPWAIVAEANKSEISEEKQVVCLLACPPHSLSYKKKKPKSLQIENWYGRQNADLKSQIIKDLLARLVRLKNSCIILKLLACPNHSAGRR